MNTILLRAGPLTLHLNPKTGDVRWIRAGAHELLHGLTSPTRDHNWDTVPTKRLSYALRRAARGFHATIMLAHRSEGVEFITTTRIHGNAQGRVTYRWEGRAVAGFRYNRVGVCLLHPQSAAGRPCRIEHADGRVREGRFPLEISPHQPFMDLRALTTELASGLAAEVRLEGEVWEMEDQRNWLDASFKTYAPPLRLPFPFTARPGQRFRHHITVRLLHPKGWQPAAARPSAAPVTLTPAPVAPPHSLALGYNWSEGDDQPLSARELRWLGALRPAHLRVDVDPADAAKMLVAAAGLRTATEAGLALEIALHAAAATAAALQSWISDFAHLGQRPVVARWLVYDREAKSVTTPRWPDAVRAWLQTAGLPAAPVITGTNCYFAELNRGRPPADALDGVCYSFNPQVHAFDPASLVETLSMVPVTVTNAQRFAAGKPVFLTPISLRPRFNPNATGTPVDRPGFLPDSVDPRQAKAFGAAWTVGLLAALARSAAAGATLFGVRGWTGVFERPEGAPHVPGFASAPGQRYPLFHVLAAVAQAGPGGFAPLVSSQPERVEALTWNTGRHRTVLIANLENHTVEADLPSLGDAARLKLLARGNRGTAAVQRLGRGAGIRVSLPGHAVATLQLPLSKN